MPVPDAVIFGPDSQSVSLTYGTVRGFSDDEKLLALKRRLDAFLVDQIEELGKDDGTSKVYSPFPLTLLTCIAIETLGQVMHDASGKGDAQRDAFVEVAKSLESNLSRQLKKKDKKAIKELFPPKDADKIDSAACILYYYLRNTLVHGYQGRGVYLTEDNTDWKLESGTIQLNPYWFWNMFKKVYEERFAKLFENKESTNPLRKNALNYLNTLLG